MTASIPNNSPNTNGSVSALQTTNPQTSTPGNNQSPPTTYHPTVEIIRSTTPLALGLIGCILGIFVLLSKTEENTKTAGFGVASTAIAGAAGLAQSHSRQE